MKLDVHTFDAKKRTKNLKKQIVLSFLAKGLAILLNLYLIPLTINYLGKEPYGIWVTMLSIISWISLCDIGIGHGLRNRLTESLATNNLDSSIRYISTAYILLLIVSIFILLICAASFPLINWPAFFNSHLNIPFVEMMMVFILFIMVSFFLGTINSILAACQLTSWSSYIPFLANSLFISFLYSAPHFFKGNLLGIVSFYGISNTIALIFISVLFFLKNKSLIPRFRYFTKTIVRDIVSLGGRFFLIQITAVIIFSTSNFLIIQFLGPDRVTDYNIVFKLFSVFNIGFTIIITPFWSAFTEAYKKNDFLWIKKAIRNLLLLLCPIVFVLIFFALYFDNIVALWLRQTANEISIPISLVVFMVVYIFISIWNNIFSFFLNGIGETSMQIKTSIFGAIMMVPISYLFVIVLDMGITGIVFAMCVCLFPFFICGPIVTYKILKNGSAG